MKHIVILLITAVLLCADRSTEYKEADLIIKDGWKNASLFKADMEVTEKYFQNSLDALNKPIELDEYGFTKNIIKEDDFIGNFVHIKYLESKKDIDSGIKILKSVIDYDSNILKAKDMLSFIYHLRTCDYSFKSIEETLSSQKLTPKQHKRLNELFTKLDLSNDKVVKMIRLALNNEIVFFKKSLSEPKIIKQLGKEKVTYITDKLSKYLQKSHTALISDIKNSSLNEYKEFNISHNKRKKVFEEKFRPYEKELNSLKTEEQISAFLSKLKKEDVAELLLLESYNDFTKVYQKLQELQSRYNSLKVKFL